MTFIIGLLSAILLLDALILVLLVLIQLPKKDAGAGMAFGAGTADALFGAGSGNALTKITKYAAATFLFLCLTLTGIQSYQNKSAKTGVGEALKKVSGATPAPAALPAKEKMTTPESVATNPAATTPAGTNPTAKATADAPSTPAPPAAPKP